MLSPHYKVNSEGNTYKFKPKGFRAKKISLIIFYPKKLSGITVRVEKGFGTKQAKRPTTHRSRSNLLRVSIFKLQSSRHYYRKTELGTKAARSQLCINLVLRCYANKGSFTKLSLLFEYTHYPYLLLLQIIHSHSLIFQQQLLMKDAYMCFYYQKTQKTF